MHLNYLIVAFLFQLTLYHSISEASVNRSSDDYIEPLIESLDFDVNDVEYEAKWIGRQVQAFPVPEELIYFLKTLKDSMNEIFQPLIARNKERPRKIKGFNPPETWILGVVNHNWNDPNYMTNFEGSYQLLYDILYSIVKVYHGENDYWGNLTEICRYNELIPIFAINKALYGESKCKLIIEGRHFKFQQSAEDSTIYPKFKNHIIDQVSKNLQKCVAKVSLQFDNYSKSITKRKDFHDGLRLLDFEELIKHSNEERILRSDFELFETARDMSFKDPEAINKLLPSIGRSKRFADLPHNLESLKEIVIKSCEAIRSGLESSMGMFVLLLGIDGCSLANIRNMSPAFLKLNEYFRLCNELTVSMRK